MDSHISKGKYALEGLPAFYGAPVMERCPSRAPLRPGVQSVDSVRGASSHQHNPFVILCDGNTDEDHGLCYGAMLLYSGNFQTAAEVDQFENARLVMGINPCRFGWTLEPGGSLTEAWSSALPPDRQGEVCHRYVLGVYEFAERLCRDFPHLLIEGCSSGGGRFDGSMLYYTPQIWCSDNTDAVDRLRIQYGTSFCYPVSTMGAHVSAVPNGITGRVIPMETRGASPFPALRVKGLDPKLNCRVNGEGSWPGDVLMQAGCPLPALWRDYRALQIHLKAE